MEEHWRWASLLGAQASGSRVWATSPRLSGSRFQLDVNCLLTSRLCRSSASPPPPPPMLLVLYSPQPGGRASLLSHSHSSAWMWVPVSKLEAPSPGCKGTKSPCTPLASCCPSLCATPQPCLGLPERWEAQASMDLPPPPFPGLSRGQLQP